MVGQRSFELSLDDDIADVVDAAVTSGGYASSDDVVNEALAEWYQRRVETPEDIARLRLLIEEGLASGGEEEVNDAWFDDIKRRGHEAIAAKRAAA